MISDKYGANEVACAIEEIQHLLNDGTVMNNRHAEMVSIVINYGDEVSKQEKKLERIKTLEEVRNLCLIECFITSDDIDRLIEQAK